MTKPLTNKDKLISAIHGYGVNMFCAGKYHREAEEKKTLIDASKEKHFVINSEKLLSDILNLLKELGL